MIKKLFKSIIRLVDGEYQPKEFWDKWSNKFIQDEWQRSIHPQHMWMLKKVKQTKPKTILEVGCGFGRNIKFLLENNIKSQITGVDISPKMIELAKKYVGKDKVKLLVADAKELPFADREFDAVLVHGVFMHVKPEDIQETIREVLRVTKKYLINVEQNYLPSESEGGRKYTFVHSYKKLYRSLGADIVEYENNKELGLDYYYVKIR